MSHDINKMVFAGETPWHKLGTKLPANGRYEDIRTAAGFYTAVERPLFAAGDVEPNPDMKAIYREDNGRYLATVGKGYEVIQFDTLAEAGVIGARDVQAIWHTAGTLGERGARGWMLAELPGEAVIRVQGDPSEIRPYFLLTTAHDGSSAAVLANVATRVVCQNTLGIALGERGGARWTIRHTKNADLRVKAAAAAFRTMTARMEKFGELANAMAKIRLSDDDFRAIVAAAVPIEDDGERHPILERQRTEIHNLRTTFKGAAPQIVGTAWGDFQAVTQWADWEKPVRALGDGAGTMLQREIGARMNAATLGDGALLKSRALEVIASRARLDLSKVAAVALA
jgi:phage/plasmid-like protein (TIGR03299 family)